MRRLTIPTAALVLLVLGCSEPRAVPIIGPDGSRMFHVSCGRNEAECYRLAGEHCPYGYDLGRTFAGAGNMLVRCRMPMAQPVYPTAQYRPAPAATYGAPEVASAPPPAPLGPASAQPAQPAPSASSSIPSASSVPYAPRPPVDATRQRKRVLPRVDFGY